MNLYLVRHGVSTANLAGRYQGWMDSELAPDGRTQARQTAAFFAGYAAQAGLTFRALYSSPLSRAWHTAGIIGEWIGLAPVAVPELREMHGGAIEGLTEAEWRERHPDYVAPWQDLANLDFGWPGGETRRAFRARCRQAIAGLLAGHAPDEHVIVVAHGGVISAYLADGDAIEPGGAEGGEIANCSITHVQFSGRGADAAWSAGCLRRFNDVRHLCASVNPALILP